ncbi:hypothetical protein EPI10_016714 [Gossypium australe]|uniref:Uncharacterized protein n=1 Tax=Gossypium australe TaxID=47621 RepID=A0A5B6VNY3_9ROSI|nr:hypothetical protein EPI10_016714 [Gossypium australe]
MFPSSSFRGRRTTSAPHPIFFHLFLISGEVQTLLDYCRGSVDLRLAEWSGLIRKKGDLWSSCGISAIYWSSNSKSAILEFCLEF